MPTAKAARGFYDQNCEPREVAPGADFEASAETIRELKAKALVASPEAKKAPEPQNKALSGPANKAKA